MDKLQYTKPSFQVHLIPLSTSGGGCNYLDNASDASVCTKTVLDSVLFVTGINNDCEEDSECYDIPINNGNIFTS